MNIRRATVKDMNGINKLLNQVLMVHHNGRPDLFKANVKKYTDEELALIIADDTKPIFVGVDEKDDVLGYAFCVFQQHINNNILTDIKTLYILMICAWMRTSVECTLASRFMSIWWNLQKHRDATI